MRSSFGAAAGLGMAAIAFPGRGGATQSESVARIRLGFDNFSLRALGWKAKQFLDYAADQKLDVMFFSDLHVYESHGTAYLHDLKAKARDMGIGIYVGTYSICPTSRALTKEFGTPEEHLGLAIRIAHSLGSPVVRCVLGNSSDRLAEGGIERQIDATVAVLKKVRSRALDSGVKIAVENHAGDMRAHELVSLIERAGTEFVGATMDSGNAVWTLEDPRANLEVLGPYALATGIRDTAVWETSDGAQTQWVSMGEGNTDWKAYVKRYAELCPDVPFILEILSEWGRSLPYFKSDFWKAFPKMTASEFSRFVAFARKGQPKQPYQVPVGTKREDYARNFQLADLERSLKYCKTVLGLGLKR